MYFQILSANVPAEASRWLAIWEESPEREVFAHPTYVALDAERTSGIATCTILRYGSIAVMYPFVQRDLSREVYSLPQLDAQSDITSAYGYCGPIVWGQGSREAAAAEFWNHFDDWARTRNVASEFVRFGLFAQNALPYPGPTWAVSQHVVRRLDKSEDELWRDFDHKVRKNVHKAQRCGVTLHVDSAARELGSFLDVYNQTMDRRQAQTSYRYSLSFFERLAQELKDSICYFHAALTGTIVSTELVLISNSSIYSFLGGTKEEYFDCRPNDLLKFEIIRWARAHEKTAYVLGGGYEPGDGIFRYKLSFAPNGIVPYFQGGRILQPELYDALVLQRECVARMRNEIWSPAQHYFPKYRG